MVTSPEQPIFSRRVKDRWVSATFLSAVAVTGLVAEFSPSDLPAINRWVGVVVAFVASVIIAPDAAAHLGREIGGVVLRSWARARDALARVFPALRRRREGRAFVSGAAGIATTGGVLVVREWNPKDPVDVRIERLRTLITEVEQKVSKVDARLSQEVEQRARELADVERRLRGELGQVRKILDQKEAEATRINARALPILGVGIFLGGVPEDLAALPLPYAWIPPIVAVHLLHLALVDLIQDQMAETYR